MSTNDCWACDPGFPTYEAMDALRADLARALDALRPFAEYAPHMIDGLPDSVGVATVQDNVNGNVSITRGDVFRARAVLADLASSDAPQSDALAALGVTERQVTNEQRTERAQRSDAETGEPT